MTKDVTRYRPYYFDPVAMKGYNADMRANLEGDYVRYDDFKVVLDSHRWLYAEKQRLEAELKRLKPDEPTSERLFTALKTIRFAGRNEHPTAVWMQKVAANAMEPGKWPEQPADPPADERTAECPHDAVDYYTRNKYWCKKCGALKLGSDEPWQLPENRQVEPAADLSRACEHKKGPFSAWSTETMTGLLCHECGQNFNVVLFAEPPENRGAES